MAIQGVSFNIDDFDVTVNGHKIESIKALNYEVQKNLPDVRRYPEFTFYLYRKGYFYFRGGNGTKFKYKPLKKDKIIVKEWNSLRLSGYGTKIILEFN